MLRAHLDRTVIAYLDNIFIYLETYKEHIKHVIEVLMCLAKVELQLNLKKYKFYKIKVAFLRFTVGINRIKISNNKIQVI